jgi:hypothetical protein
MNTLTRTVCPKCGVTSFSWTERVACQPVTFRRDYMPVTVILTLKPDAVRPYVALPALVRFDGYRIRKLEDDKLRYAIDIPVPEDGRWIELLNCDRRIENWHTLDIDHPDPSNIDAPQVCESHVYFKTNRYPR